MTKKYCLLKSHSKFSQKKLSQNLSISHIAIRSIISTFCIIFSLSLRLIFNEKKNLLHLLISYLYFWLSRTIDFDDARIIFSSLFGCEENTKICYFGVFLRGLKKFLHRKKNHCIKIDSQTHRSNVLVLKVLPPQLKSSLLDVRELLECQLIINSRLSILDLL